jgi:hypothetical protein
MAASLRNVAYLYDANCGQSGWVRRSKVVGKNLAYMTSYTGNAFSIYDVTNPYNPKLISQCPCVAREGLQESLDGKYVFTAFSTKLEAFDVSNPRLPFLAASLTDARINGMSLRMSADGNTLFVFGGTTGSDIAVIDVTNPLAPAIASIYSAGTAWGGQVVGSLLYYVTKTTGLFCVDISDPSSLQAVGNISLTDTTKLNVTIRGNRAYVIRNTAQTLTVVDITDPAAMAAVGSPIALGYKPWVVDIESTTHLFITDSVGDTVRAYSLTNPDVPALLATGAVESQTNGPDDAFYSAIDGMIYVSGNSSYGLLVYEFIASDTGAIIVANKEGAKASTAADWNIGGSAAGRVPAAGDIVRPAGYTVEVDVDTFPATGTFAVIEGKDAAGAAAAGKFTITFGEDAPSTDAEWDATRAVTINTKRIIGGTSPLFQTTGYGRLTGTGYVTGGSAADARSVSVESGMLRIAWTGIIEGGSKSGCYGVYVSADCDGIWFALDGTLRGGISCEGMYFGASLQGTAAFSYVSCVSGGEDFAAITGTETVSLRVTEIAKAGGTGICTWTLQGVTGRVWQFVHWTDGKSAGKHFRVYVRAICQQRNFH